MTAEDINERVARKLGSLVCDHSGEEYRYLDSSKSYTHGANGHHYIIPDYCRDIKAAWEIVEKLKNENLVTLWWHDGEWECDIEHSFSEADIGKAETAPMAICLAFLKMGE